MKSKLFTIVLTSLLVNVACGVTYTSGHAGIGFGEHDELHLHIHAHEGTIIDGVALAADQEFMPDEIITEVPDATRFSRPTGQAWDLIGNGAGDDTWKVPGSENEAESMGAPFLGIHAEHLELGAFVDNQVTLTLTALSGPGQFSAYTTSLGNPSFAMSSADGISAADNIVLDLEIEDHAHLNFGFSRPGVYNVSFEVSAIDAETQQLVTDAGTFTFHVVPEPATMSLLTLGAVAALRKRKS